MMHKQAIPIKISCQTSQFSWTIDSDVLDYETILTP
jgi:hypothetical protein